MGTALAEEYLEDSKAAANRASELISKTFDFVGAIEAAQHSIELSVKALYLLVREEPPKEHHAGQEFLRKVADRLSFSRNAADYWKANLGRIMWISRMYEWAHTVSVYGYKGISASKLITKKDAEIASGYAYEVHLICRHIMDAVSRKEISIGETSQ